MITAMLNFQGCPADNLRECQKRGEGIFLIARARRPSNPRHLARAWVAGKYLPASDEKAHRDGVYTSWKAKVRTASSLAHHRCRWKALSPNATGTHRPADRYFETSVRCRPTSSEKTISTRARLTRTVVFPLEHGKVVPHHAAVCIREDAALAGV